MTNHPVPDEGGSETLVDPFRIAYENPLIERAFREIYYLGNAYDCIDHPAKETILATLASLEPNPTLLENSYNRPDTSWQINEQRNAMILNGILYFDAALEAVAQDKVPERKVDADFFLFSDTPKVQEPQPLPPPTSSLNLEEVILKMISLQAHDAFVTAYNSSERFMTIHRSHPAVKIATGLVLAKQLTNIDNQTIFNTVGYSIGGNTEFVRDAYDSFVQGGSIAATKYVINGAPAGPGFTPQEVGLGIFRTSGTAATDVMRAQDIFWGKRDGSFGIEVEDLPQFTREDAIHLTTGHEGLKLLVNNARQFPKLGIEDFKAAARLNAKKSSEWLERRYGFELEKVVTAFEIDQVKDPKDFSIEMLELGYANFSWEFYKQYKKQPIPSFEIFRQNITPEMHTFTEEIAQGQLNEEHAALGITESGAKGIEQLKKVINGIQQFIIQPDKSPEDFLAEYLRVSQSPIYESLWRAAVRFDQTAWGSKTGHELQRVLAGFSDPDSGFNTAPLNTDVYQTSELVPVAELNKTSEPVNADVEKAIEAFCELAKFAWIDESGETFEARVRGIDIEVDYQYLNLGTMMTKAQTDTQKQRLAEQRQRYEYAREAGVTQIFTKGDFLDAYDTVGDLRIARDLLREKALREIAKTDHYENLRQAYATVLAMRDVKEELAAALEVIDHQIVQEYLLKLRPDDKQYTWFVKNVLFNTSIIRAELERLEQRQTVAVTSRQFRFIPSRDLGLELSGQIGDACWASRYKSIAETMPNMTAVLIAEENEDSRQLVGSGLLIEATAEDGQELLIVRGLNPIENVINKIDAAEFLEKFLGYARTAAQKSGRKLAMVYDDHIGGAATNRQSLYRAMGAKVRTDPLAQNGPIDVPVDQVRFNNYSLQNSIFLVS